MGLKIDLQLYDLIKSEPKMDIQTAKKLVNAISKVTLKNNLLCIYRYEMNHTTVPYLLIPLQVVRSVNIIPGLSNDGSFVTVVYFKGGEKEVIHWNYSYNYGDCNTRNRNIITWREEVEKQIEDMVELIASGTASAAQKFDKSRFIELH